MNSILIPQQTQHFPRALRFYSGNTWACWIYPYSIRTIFCDGSAVEATTPQEDYFRESAQYLGYEDDIDWHMREHDVLHHIVADLLGFPYSGAIWAQAHGYEAAPDKPMPKKGQEEEERLVAIQRLLNHRPPTGNTWAERGYEDLVKRYGTPSAVMNLISSLRDELRSHSKGGAMTRLWAYETNQNLNSN